MKPDTILLIIAIIGIALGYMSYLLQRQKNDDEKEMAETKLKNDLHINRIRMNFELFERRYELYNTITTYLIDFYLGRSNNTDMIRFSEAQYKVNFLFNEKVFYKILELGDAINSGTVAPPTGDIVSDEFNIKIKQVYLLMHPFLMLDKLLLDTS